MFTRNNILKCLSIEHMAQENKFEIIEKNQSGIYLIISYKKLIFASETNNESNYYKYWR